MKCVIMCVTVLRQNIHIMFAELVVNFPHLLQSRIKKCSPLNSALIQPNRHHTFLPHILQLHFNIILPPYLRSSSSLLYPSVAIKILCTFEDLYLRCDHRNLAACYYIAEEHIIKIPSHRPWDF
jgi:hypothetical protein